MNVPAGDLASYKRCTEGIAAAWPTFQAARADRLRHGNETEKVAEAIIEDLFARVLDWDPGDLMYGVDYADIVVSRNLAKYLVIETKRPGTLWPGRKALHEAVRQARGYADRQNIKSVAASDGRFLYTADIIGGGLVDRLLVDLAAPEPPLGLWWVSMHGIYRPCEAPAICVPITSDEPSGARSATSSETNLLHPKYKLPVECFAYVPDASQPKTWKLPYRLLNGEIDAKRLPKAIQSLLSNYRGAKVSGIPMCDIPAILFRLAEAADHLGHMPPKAVKPAQIYQQLALVLEQIKR